MILDTELSASRPVRILLLESATGPGGSVNFIRDFVHHVDHSRALVIAGLYFPNPSKALEELQRHGYPVVFFQNSRPLPPKTSAATCRHSSAIGTSFRSGDSALTPS